MVSDVITPSWFFNAEISLSFFMAICSAMTACLAGGRDDHDDLFLVIADIRIPFRVLSRSPSVYQVTASWPSRRNFIWFSESGDASSSGPIKITSSFEGSKSL